MQGHSDWRSLPAWAWTPQHGRWTPRHGYPPIATHVEVSTDGVAPSEAFDFWREIACYDWDPARPDLAQPFNARATAIIAQDAEFYSFGVSALEGARSRKMVLADGFDTLSIGIVLSGRRQAEAEDDRAEATEPAGIFVHDASRPSRIAWSDGRGVHLLLRRQALTAIFGQAIPAPSALARTLAGSPLSELWRQQMRDMARHGPVLPPAERSFALGQLHALTQFMLGQMKSGSLRSAAMALIDARLADPNMGVDWLVARLGCSRATLYRAFDEDARGIAGLITDLRYERARRMLAEQPDRPIADVAMASGLYDTVNFSRGFRSRYGMAPGVWRQWVQTNRMGETQ